jgi:hypothetical protein
LQIFVPAIGWLKLNALEEMNKKDKLHKRTNAKGSMLQQCLRTVTSKEPCADDFGCNREFKEITTAAVEEMLRYTENES